MIADPTLDGLDAVLADLRDDPALLVAAAEAARAMGSPDKALPGHEVRRHITALLEAATAALEGDSSRTVAAIAAADELAVDRARQGVPLDALLDGVRGARAVLLRALVDAAGVRMPAEQLVAVLPALDATLAELQNSMIVHHQRAWQDLTRSRRQAQVEALRELLDGGPATWAREAGLDTATEYHCLLVDVSTPTQSRRLEQAIETGDGVSAIVHGYLCRVTTRLPSAERLGTTLAVAAGPVAVDRLAATSLLCREALAVHRDGGACGLQPIAGAALGIATGARPELGRLLQDDLLTALHPEDEFHRLVVRTTLTYLEQGRQALRAAEVLHVHPNTVKYRVRRFVDLVGSRSETDLFGGPLSRSMTWWWALSTWDRAQRPSSP